MKKGLLFIVLIQVAMFSYAQGESKFRIGIEGGLGLNYRYLITKDAIAQKVVDSRNVDEIPAILPVSGITFSWMFRDRMMLSSGVRWNMKGYRTISYNTTDPIIDRRMGSSGLDGLQSVRYNYFSQWLEIPVQFRWNIIQKRERSSWFVEGGFTVAYKLTAQQIAKLSYSDRTETRRSSEAVVRDWLTFANLGMGYSLNLGKRFGLDIAVEAQYSLIPLDKDMYDFGAGPTETPINAYFWSITPKVGLNYKL